LAALFVLLIVLIRSQQRERRWAFWLLAGALVLAVLLNAHDLAWWMGWIDYESYQLAHFHIPLVLFAIGATIVDRHFRAVAAVERAKLELEGRVAEKAREIEANYASVQEAEREKALARERQRIMADMHDGLGSSLVALLGSVQSGQAALPEVERRLHDALQELRPPLPSFTPNAVLSIQRNLHEALTDSLRHARARDVTVSTRMNGTSLQIGVSDNGIGFDETSVTSGRGLESVRQRARDPTSH